MLRSRLDPPALTRDPYAQLERSGSNAAIVPVIPDEELESPRLPREHPKWVKDAVAISQRARQLIARLHPIALAVMTFWDHRLRAITIGTRRLNVDASGSYRIG